MEKRMKSEFEGTRSGELGEDRGPREEDGAARRVD